LRGLNHSQLSLASPTPSQSRRVGCCSQLSDNCHSIAKVVADVIRLIGVRSVEADASRHGHRIILDRPFLNQNEDIVLPQPDHTCMASSVV
jgi:hypothetical protein